MPPVLRRFLDAVEARDADGAAACFADEATYANVPHPPVVGPGGVRGLLAPILGRSAWVRWDADRITAFRDYVDLGEWRARLGDVLGSGP